MNKKKKNDPKYKTELCKSFRDTNFCPYGNRCRFAHGKSELFIKALETNKYKLKECNSFKENGFCLYGSRCNFKHGENKMENINRSFYSHLLNISVNKDFNIPFFNTDNFFIGCTWESANKSNRRLDVFSALSKNSENLSTSESSNDSFTGSFNLGNSKLNLPKYLTSAYMNKISKCPLDF